MIDDQIQTGDDLAAEALAQADEAASTSVPVGGGDEVDESNQVAQTIMSLQNVIERNARELERINEELKHKRESMKNIFENDAELATAEEQVSLLSTQAKERKAKLQTDPQMTTLKVQVGELNEQKKEVEETLSNHLVNYHTLTGSKSFDTSEGDQWDFDIRAKVKSRKGGK